MFEDRIAALEAEFSSVEADLADPAVLSDSDRVRDLSRRHKELGEIVRTWHELQAARDDVATGREMLTEAAGDERELMRLEVEEAEASVAELEERIQSLLLPKDPNVGRNVIIEIRGAVGGDEANLFARVLYDMYQRYAATKKWKVELLSEDASDKDGINEAVFLLKGSDAYIRMEHEGGTHRVQRVPVTEAKGRVHTSTATVTVLPEAAEVEIDIDPNDLKIDVYRSTGPGGQSVNTTDSAVRITHLPTNTVVAMQDEKSQIQNRAKAMVVLRARLLKAEQDRQAAAMSAQRRGQVGAGNRTDKIRTYNFKENRVTDHRINLTLYKLDQVLAGDLDELTDALMADKRGRQLSGEDDPTELTRGELMTELAATLGARHEARFILDEVFGPAGDPTHPRDEELDPSDVATALELARRRRTGEPLQYVLGHWAFRSLDLIVDPRVLIPRPETEQVVEVARAELIHLGVDRPLVVDAGTGSGAIALSLAAELGDAAVWAVDASAAALAVAALNLERVRQQLDGRTLRVTLSEGSWLTALPESIRGSVNLVVANPPYVSEAEWAELPDDVRTEPHGALVAPAATDGTPGLADVEEVLSQSLRWLTRPGAVVIELAPHQAEAAARLAVAMGYVDVRVAPDLAQRPRALVGRVRVSGDRIVGPHDRVAVLGALDRGEIIAVPGVGSYWLATRSDDADVRRRLAALTPTPMDTDELHLMVGHRSQARGLASEWTEEINQLIVRCWPGPLTVILAALDDGSNRGTGNATGNATGSTTGSIVRVSMAVSGRLRRLCQESGPWLVAPLTPPQHTAATVGTWFDEAQVGLIVDDGLVTGLGPTLVDCTRSPAQVVSEGALPASFVQAAQIMGSRRRFFSGRRTGRRPEVRPDDPGSTQSG